VAIASAEFENPHPAFSGWRICAAGVATQAIAIGFTLGAVGLFAAPLADELGATATQFNLGVSLFTLVMNLAMPVVGGLLDRGSIRRVMMAGAVILALSLAVMSRATELWQVGLLFGGGCAVGMTMLGPISSSTAMANWFSRLRGRALGFANAGGPLGPALIVPVAAYTIGEFGWRPTMLGFAAATLLAALPTIFFGMIDRPSDVGQYPDADEPSDLSTGSPGEMEAGVAWNAASLIRSRDFWLVALGVAPFAAAGLVMGANAIPYMMYLGTTAESASIVVVLQSSGAVAGPLLFGSLADRIHPRLLFLGLVGTISLGLAALMLEPGYPFALAIFSVLGLCGGSMMPVYGALIGRLFGAESFGLVMGFGALVGLPTLFLAPLGFGYAFDVTDSYSTGLLGMILALALGGGLLALLTSGVARRGPA
jgi:MFS family permease